MPLVAGTKLGPYEITSLIGEGGMGEVYRARDTRLGRDVAVKMLTSVVAKDKEQITRFAQEARATGLLNHPNLLTIFDIGTANGAPFIVSELLEGQTLRDRLIQAPIPVRKAIDYSLQIANGLAAAHDKGIVHRDLKPENIFITRDERVKILDFGIAKLNPQAAGEGATFQMAATTPGMVLGTVGYMSPEQVRGETVDQRSDIFSFGTILYEMLSGSRAFRRDSSIETLSAILKEDPPDLLESFPAIPPALERVVRRCLEKNRELRFQNARDLAFHLESLASMASPTSGTAARASAPPARPATVEAEHVLTNSPTARLAAPAQGAGAPPVSPTAQRPRPVPAPVKKRKVAAPALLWVLAVAAVLGAAFGGYRYAQIERDAVGSPSYHRVTFRRGEIKSARFSPDGDMIVYSAAWDGNPVEVFITTRQNPESRPLGVPNSEVAAVSKSAELAIVLNRDRVTGLGTLARVPLVGGTPREVADNVFQADWAADGNTLAAIRFVDGEYRLEYPVGTVRYRSPRQLRELRFSPAGDRIAFVEQRAGAYDVLWIDAQGNPTPLAHGWSKGLQGLAWTPDGREVWISGAETAAPPALYAINEHGEPRLVERLTGSVRLHDVSASGRLLMTHTTWRAALMYSGGGDPVERDLSWFDWSIVADLSAGGRTLLFNESREGGGEKSAIYVRHVDKPAPVRIGDGVADALSPDGRWALSHDGANLVLVPTGTGEPVPLKVAGSFDLGAVWHPDSRHAVIAGAEPGKGYALHMLDVQSGRLRRISVEGIPGDAYRPFAISPDGRFVAGLNKENRIVLYPVAGGAPIVLTGVEAGEIPLQWSADALSLYVYRPTMLPVNVFKVDLATGGRELWKTFAPGDPAGVYRIAPIVMTRDASAYAYNSLRNLSDLYVVEKLIAAKK